MAFRARWLAIRASLKSSRAIKASATYWYVSFRFNACIPIQSFVWTHCVFVLSEQTPKSCSKMKGWLEVLYQYTVQAENDLMLEMEHSIMNSMIRKHKLWCNKRKAAAASKPAVQQHIITTIAVQRPLRRSAYDDDEDFDPLELLEDDTGPVLAPLQEESLRSDDIGYRSDSDTNILQYHHYDRSNGSNNSITMTRGGEEPEVSIVVTVGEEDDMTRGLARTPSIEDREETIEYPAELLLRRDPTSTPSPSSLGLRRNAAAAAIDGRRSQQQKEKEKETEATSYHHYGDEGEDEEEEDDQQDDGDYDVLT